jgi:2-polyprenyl-6-methoxyphenol hydroxylase-like FAD-dependent oxidoreductase
VEKSGWLFENFSRLILTQPLGCLTDVLVGADGVSSLIRAGLHAAEPPRPAESALREHERLRIPRTGAVVRKSLQRSGAV